MLSDKRRQTLKGAAYKLLTVASMRPGALLGQVISHSETLTEIFDELDDSSSVLRTRVSQSAFHLCKHAGPAEKFLVENNIIPKLFSASVSFKASSDYLRRLTQYQGTVFDFTMVSFCFRALRELLIVNENPREPSPFVAKFREAEVDKLQGFISGAFKALSEGSGSHGARAFLQISDGKLGEDLVNLVSMSSSRPPSRGGDRTCRIRHQQSPEMATIRPVLAD